MRTFNQWMDAYGVSHQNPVNQKIHKICVPAIMLTVVGFFWCIPRPAFFQNIPYLNWGTIFLVLCLAFYFTLNMMMFIGMTVQAIVMSVICEYIYRTGNLLPFCIIVFVIAWIGQFYGHKVEGKKPSFLDDLVFLLIGPLWVTRFFYKKIGINV